jgi:hypothetical protein
MAAFLGMGWQGTGPCREECIHGVTMMTKIGGRLFVMITLNMSDIDPGINSVTARDGG